MSKRGSAKRGSAPPSADSLPPRILAVRGLLARVNGARLCFGKPVTAHGHTVIPVAKLFAAGGGGFGSGDEEPTPSPEDGLGLPAELVRAGSGDDVGRGWGSVRATSVGSGGGGGGTITASPIGFIEITPEGTRFAAIPDPERSARMVSLAVKALPALVAAAAGLRALRSGPGSDELAGVLRMPRGRRVRPRVRATLPSPRRSPRR